MEELEQRVMDAFQSAPDLMGGLMHVYRLGFDEGQVHTNRTHDGEKP